MFPDLMATISEIYIPIHFTIPNYKFQFVCLKRKKNTQSHGTAHIHPPRILLGPKLWGHHPHKERNAVTVGQYAWVHTQKDTHIPLF